MRNIIRYLAYIILCFFTFFPSRSALPAPSDEVPKAYEVRLLREMGKYDKAIELALRIINNEGAEKEELTTAYNELVQIYIIKKDQENARKYALELLRKYPDVSPDPEHYSNDLINLYKELKKERFSTVTIKSNKSDIKVYIDEFFAGTTPLTRELEVGIHELKLQSPSGRVKRKKVKIEAGENYNFSFEFPENETIVPVAKRRFGVEMSFGTSQLKYENAYPSYPSENISLISGGIFSDFRTGTPIIIQPGIRFTRIGAKGELYDLTLQYYSVPIEALIFPPPNNLLFISVGIEPGILISAKEKEHTSVGESTRDVRSFYSTLNFALSLGGGIRIDFKRFSIQFEGKYLIGINDINNHPEENKSAKTRELRISLAAIK